jgi:flagellar FliL protein
MAAEQEEEQVEKKKLPIVKILIMGLVGLLLVGVGAGGTVAYFILTKPPEDNPLAIVIEKKQPADAHGDGHGAPAAGGKDAPKDAHGAPAAPAGPAGKPVPSKEQFATTYFEFPGNFTTNLRGSKRFVQVSIGLATQYDKKVIENVQKHEVAIRAEVLALIAEQSEVEVIGVENRKRMQNAIKDVINRVLTERTEFGGIENVYITALVMQ